MTSEGISARDALPFARRRRRRRRACLLIAVPSVAVVAASALAAVSAPPPRPAAVVAPDSTFVEAAARRAAAAAEPWSVPVRAGRLGLPCARSRTIASASGASASASAVTSPASLQAVRPQLRSPGPLRVLADAWRALTTPYRMFVFSRITSAAVADALAAPEVRAYVARQKAETHQADAAAAGGGALAVLKDFVADLMRSHVAAGTSSAAYRRWLETALKVIMGSISATERHAFEPYHKAIRGPDFDYYKWGNDFFRSVVKLEASRAEGLEQIAAIRRRLAEGGNVILLANHQTEADPQVISLLLEMYGESDLAERMIFVAGHKVTTDPVAIPFSMGRNLLTIYSKKYLDQGDAEEKKEKNARNRATVSELQRLLTAGGQILWVAPSGGRDRRTGENGAYAPAAFDPQSIGLFHVVGQKAAKDNGPRTHFFPLAMWSYNLVPSPDDAKSAVGEARRVERTPVGIEIGPELDLSVVGRDNFAQAAEAAVRRQYAHLDMLLR
eukprot:TRINITY_DN16999_c0_g1_i2.p1 TRINITY_DN16999_c0_g1~~TRINITY_DN16999_c0_g1_i2.p1  ORF type:complete len:501 (+),score=89.23 TRINITY_DN16999_c0_g1_i2:52-1554(+)